MSETCPTCGCADPAGTTCCALATLICVGHHPTPGCGAVLTAEEQHFYGDSCEACATAWGEQIAAWREGNDDPELDAMFDAKETLQ
jgi:hypothetical protein